MSGTHLSTNKITTEQLLWMREGGRPSRNDLPPFRSIRDPQGVCSSHS
ncbi:MAG: hypothetical protein R6V02_00595 [Candidatus Aminicenantes bacterium]